MQPRRLRTAALAASAALVPLLVLATGTQASARPSVGVTIQANTEDSAADGPQELSKEAQCAAAYDFNVKMVGVSYAITQYEACMG
ncbi:MULTISPECIES: hypothetical protein [Kitasatospora]|uniref:Secreted protein n=2 Tax=Kitasatospora setae TaxID=2066 RepID=E4N113_KITSK|nr:MULTISPECIES: hypothetical protein [Kitasatospora]BAJ31847.1 hypothetical protein KSE_60810 [Kitasatospora setae KM-6054]